MTCPARSAWPWPTFGLLDLLWANAGIGVAKTVPEMTLEEWDRVLAVNLTGAFLLAKFGIPELAAAGGGTMVITGSANSFTADRSWAAYCASKGGLLMLCRALALDHASDGVRVNIVCPGSVATPLHEAWLRGPARRPAARRKSAARWNLVVHRPHPKLPADPVELPRPPGSGPARSPAPPPGAAAGGRGARAAAAAADYSIRVIEFARAPSPLGLLLHGQAGEREIPYCSTVLRSAEHTTLVHSELRHTERGRDSRRGRDRRRTTRPSRRPGRGRARGRRRDPGHPRALRPSRERRGLPERHDLDPAPRSREVVLGGQPAADMTARARVSLDDLATLLRWRAGPAEAWWTVRPRTCSPGSAWCHFDTHTDGHEHVVIRTASSGARVVPGDVMFRYANIEGMGGDGRYVPLALAMGSEETCMLALDEPMRVTGGETSRILPGHEQLCGSGTRGTATPTAWTWPRCACGRATRAGAGTRSPGRGRGAPR